MSSSDSTLDQVLRNYSHLDLTYDIDEEAKVQIGGGGYSDVFHTQMRPACKVHLGSDKIVEEILAETRYPSPEFSSGCIGVAVKRLRIWGKPNPTIEKVIREATDRAINGD